MTEKHSPLLPCPFCGGAPATDENARFRAALEEIANEQKVYKGHGDYDIIPALTAKEAQTRARFALNEQDELPDVNDGEDYLRSKRPFQP